MAMSPSGARTAIAAALLAALTAGCPNGDTARPPVTTTQATEARATTRPAEAASRVEVLVHSPGDPQRGWLAVEGIRDSAIGAWATGSFIPANKIVIDTENVEQFSIDLSRLRINWNRRVVLRIDGRSSELIKKRRPVLRLRRSPAGSWDVVEP